MKKASYLVLIICLIYVTSAFASVSVTVNGTSHTIPQTNEKGWGTNVTAWIQAISQYTLQPTGGTFTLTAEVDTGATYGFKVPYIKTQTANPSTVGVLRLAKTDSIGFRNNANSNNLLLSIDTSDRLTFNSVIVPTATAASVQDSTFSIYDNGDASKKIAFEASAITTGNTRTITVPDAAVDLTDLTSATNGNTASKIVKRDASGNFSAGTVTANLTGNVTGNVTGNADTATALAANPSDCAADTYATTIAANGNLTCATVTNAGLAGSIAASKLVGSDIATVGTVTSGTWSATTVAVNKGGTGQTTYTDGQLLIGNSSGSTLTKATISAGSGITVTNGNGSITIASSGATPQFTYTSQTTTYSAAINDYIKASGASFTITLPDASTSGYTGKSIIVEHAGTSLTQVYTINTTSAQTITHAGTAYTSGQISLYTAGEKFVFISDGANWRVLRHDTETPESDAGVLTVTSSSAYSFTLNAAATIAAGTVYTSNGNTFIVSTASSASTTLLAYGTGSPGASGTLTFVSGTSGNRTFTAVSTTGLPVWGTSSYNRYIWARSGKFLVGRWEYSATGNGTGGTGILGFYYPTGLLPDTTNMAQATEVLSSSWTTSPSIIGEGYAFGSGVSSSMSWATNSWPTMFVVYSSQQGAWNSADFNIMQSTARFSLLMRYPVTGWLP